MPGTPCVFMTHWLAYPSQIKAMVAARKAAGIHNQSGYSQVSSKVAYYANIIKNGNADRLMVVVGDVAQNEANVDAAKWTKVVEGHHYAYYFPATMETAYADLPSGSYEGEQTVRLAAVSAQSGASLVYTTDGSTPTAASNVAATGTKVVIPVGATTTLKVGLLVGGQVSGIVSRTYEVKMNEKDRPVEAPDFCTVAEGETCAFFEAPATWGETIMCWAWIDGGAVFTGTAWPGIACRRLGEAANGNAVWKWTYSGSLTTRPQKIIFNNNGSPQTDDMTFQNGGYYNQYGLKATVTAK
jgi:alpha-amylase